MVLGLPLERHPARRPARRRADAHGHGTDLRPGPRRLRRRRGEGRAADGRQHAPASRLGRRVLRHVQPQQAQPRAWTSKSPRDWRRAARPRRGQTSWSRTSGPARWTSSASAFTTARREPATDILLTQRLPARALRSSRSARRGRADDGRPRLHDRAAGPAAARGTSAIDIMGGMFGAIAILAALKSGTAPGAAPMCRAACSRTSCCSWRSTWRNTP